MFKFLKSKNQLVRRSQGKYLIVTCLMMLVAAGIAAAAMQEQEQLAEVLSAASIAVKPQPQRPADGLKLMTVRDAVDRQAVCNDGSPAKYYFRPGSEANKDKWVIFFKGGGGCYDEASCLKRASEDRSLVSSKSYAQTIHEDGIFTADKNRNPDFYDWNQVKIMYCSSDNFIGDNELMLGSEPWYFKGKAIMNAIIADLQDPEVIQTENLSKASQILVAGSSAGGGGAAHNIDDITVMFPKADVKGIIDSSWGLDIEPYVVNPDNSEDDRSELASFANKQLDNSCVTSNAANPDTCTTVSSVYPYLETPVFIFINQFDHKKLEGHGVKNPIDAGERAWLENTFLPTLKASFATVDAEDGLFSARQSFHTMLTSPEYFKVKIDNVTVQQAFTDWYFNRTNSEHLVE